MGVLKSGLQLVDTHCHIHSSDYPLEPDKVIAEAEAIGVNRLICVGTTVEDSIQGVNFVQDRPNCWASIGIHPHDALKDEASRDNLQSLAKKPKVVAVGECGLDYFYNNSPKDAQERILRFQIELALENNLPMIFHVREAFADFWPIFDSHKGIRGVLHSFTDTKDNLDAALERGLYVGINGITTFTKNDWQLENAKNLPLDNLLLETDAPFLTPAPYRGTINSPAHVRRIAEFMADLKQISVEEIAQTSTANAQKLFSI